MLSMRMVKPPVLLPWDDVSTGPPDKRRVFTVRSDLVRSQATGVTHTVDRLLGPDWVNVVAITQDAHMLFVRQWRFGARAFTLELPAGVLEAGEDPIAGGLRELREETGHGPHADHPARCIGTALPNPAFMNNRCTTVLAPCVTRIGTQQLDAMEEVEVVFIAVSDIDTQIRSGALSTALGLVALQWWRLAQ